MSRLQYHCSYCLCFLAVALFDEVTISQNHNKKCCKTCYQQVCGKFGKITYTPYFRLLYPSLLLPVSVLLFSHCSPYKLQVDLM